MCKTMIIQDLLKYIDRGLDIPYALERAASSHGINIQLLKEICEDVNEKESEYINSESGPSYEYGTDWEQIE